MTDPMARTQIYLPRDIYEWLKQRADDQGTTMALQIREALTEYIVEHQPVKTMPILREDDPIWELIGVEGSGMADGAENHDNYIYARDWEMDEDNL